MPNNTDTQRELIMRYINNSHNSRNIFNNIINTINQQDLALHDLISNVRPFNLYRERRLNNRYINNPWAMAPEYPSSYNWNTNNSTMEPTINNQQIQTLEERLAQSRNLY